MTCYVRHVRPHLLSSARSLERCMFVRRCYLPASGPMWHTSASQHCLLSCHGETQPFRENADTSATTLYVAFLCAAGRLCPTYVMIHGVTCKRRSAASTVVLHMQAHGICPTWGGECVSHFSHPVCMVDGTRSPASSSRRQQQRIAHPPHCNLHPRRRP